MRIYKEEREEIRKVKVSLHGLTRIRRIVQGGLGRCQVYLFSIAHMSGIGYSLICVFRWRTVFFIRRPQDLGLMRLWIKVLYWH